jgi:hypothetical protein
LTDFDANEVFMHVSKENEKNNDHGGGVFIHLNAPFNQSFYMAGRNSSPESKEFDANAPRGIKPKNPYEKGANEERANRYETKDKNTLNVTYTQRIMTPPKVKFIERIFDLSKQNVYRYEDLEQITLDEEINVPSDALGGIEFDFQMPELDSLKPGLSMEIRLNFDWRDIASLNYDYKQNGNSLKLTKTLPMPPPGSHTIRVVISVNIPWDLIRQGYSFQFKGNATLTVSSGRLEEQNDDDILKEKRSYVVIPCGNNYSADSVSQAAYENAENHEAVEAAIMAGLSEILSLQKPVFYQDKENQHTFFIESSVTERTIEDWQDWITQPPRSNNVWEFKDSVVIPEKPKEETLHDPEEPFLNQKPFPEPLTKPEPGTDWLINPATVLLFDNVLIGPNGQAGLQLLPDVLAKESTPVGVCAGSRLAHGSTVVVKDSTALKQSGLIQTTGGLNVVGKAGFNRALDRNLTDLSSQGFGAATSANGRNRRETRRIR